LGRDKEMRPIIHINFSKIDKEVIMFNIQESCLDVANNVLFMFLCQEEHVFGRQNRELGLDFRYQRERSVEFSIQTT